MFAEVFKDFSTIDTKPVQLENNSNVINGNTRTTLTEPSNTATLSNTTNKNNIVASTNSDNLLEKSTSSNTSLVQCNEIVINRAYNHS